MYFLMIRPQQKRAKEQKAMMEALAKGDEVVTAGVLGQVTKVTTLRDPGSGQRRRNGGAEELHHHGAA
jgi:hypothetical protein